MKKSSAKRRVRFEFEGDESCAVFVAGTFNGWDPKKHKLKFKDRKHSTSLLIDKGRHEYKFIVDDRWCVDPECEDWVPNDQGSLNSVMVVQ